MYMDKLRDCKRDSSSLFYYCSAIDSMMQKHILFALDFFLIVIIIIIRSDY